MLPRSGHDSTVLLGKVLAVFFRTDIPAQLVLAGVDQILPALQNKLREVHSPIIEVHACVNQTLRVLSDDRPRADNDHEESSEHGMATVSKKWCR